MADEYKFPVTLRTAMERAAVVLHNLANVRHRDLDEDSQGLMRRVLDDLDSACTEANLATRRAATSSPVADDGLPPLPKPDVNELEPYGPPTAYSAAKARQAQREAYEAGCQAREGGAEVRSKTAETRMAAGFQGGAELCAQQPAPGDSVDTPEFRERFAYMLRSEYVALITHIDAWAARRQRKLREAWENDDKACVTGYAAENVRLKDELLAARRAAAPQLPEREPKP